MKKYSALLLSIFCLVTFAQKKRQNEDLILFEKAVAIQELIDDDLRYKLDIDSTDINKKEFATEIKEEILNKAIEIYEQLINEHPKSKLVFRALNNKGIAEYQLEDYDTAKTTFLKVLNSNANDKEKGGAGSGIMGEPYANYKNRACEILAEIELKDKNYKEAIHYLDLTKKYPYQHFCGNAHAEEEINIAEMYSKCYLGLNQYEKAYDTLLPHIIENGLASNSDLVNTTVDALLKNYKREELKVLFQNSFKNVIVEKEKKYKDEYTIFYIRFLNRKIELNSWQLHEMLTVEEKDKVLNEILAKSEFYILLNK